MAVARAAASGHLAVGNVERCEKRHCAAANVVVAASLDLAWTHRQQ
jgi:hypothetical protein